MPSPFRPAFFLLAAVWLTASGCLSPQVLRQEIDHDRETAARDWARRIAGQDPAMPRLTGALELPRALDLALLHNKRLQSVRLEKEIAAAQITESYSEALPTVTAEAGYARIGPADSYVPAAPDDPFNAYSASVQLRQPLYRGGAIGAALRASRLYALWADEQARAGAETVIQAVAATFYEVLLAERLEAVAGASVESAVAQLKTARDRASAGTAARYDVLRAEVAVANAESDLIQQRNRNRLARNRLFQLMGVTADPALELSGELRFVKADPSPDAALQLAHRRRSDLRQAELMVRLQAESLQVARSRYYPKLSGVASHDWTLREDGTALDGDWQRSWSAGLQLDLALFDGLAREGKIDQERILLRRRQVERAEAEERVLLEINQALAGLQDAEKLVASQALNLARAREALALAEAGFREGVNTGADLTDARAALRLAEGLHAQALYAHTLSRLDLKRAVGALTPDDPDPAALPDFSTGDRP